MSTADGGSGFAAHRVAAVTHGRYLLQAPAEPAGRPLLVGFHGYGENAERSLEQLRRIPGAEGWILCAVEALHLFYNRADEVVASWMTRAGREQAILDNVRYVTGVVAEVRAQITVGGAADRLAVIGFSQGTAMAYRAAAAGLAGLRGVVALGGDVPPELAQRSLEGFPPVLLGRGDREEWYTAEKMAKDLALLQGKGVEVRTAGFAGGHEWTDEFRAAAGRFLTEVLGG
jgi:predicted esterase